MTEMRERDIQKILSTNPHLASYLQEIKKTMDAPIFLSNIPRELKNESKVNIIYPTKGFIFIHIYPSGEQQNLVYLAIEPVLSDIEREKELQVLDLILTRIIEKKSAITDDELRKNINELIEELIIIDKHEEKNISGKPLKRWSSKKPSYIKASELQKQKIQYFIIKELLGGGKIECFMRDPYIEDIHVIAGENIHLIHKIFGMIKTNVIITHEEAPRFIKILSERMGSPVSEGRPIVDGVLPDGSRGNIIFSKAISIKGPSMTIRRFSENPISITQLIEWKTLSAGIGAYLWLCLQYGRSFFLCGGTACGKTTTMNAIIPFVPPEKKIYTAEGTPELQVPHTVWQRLLTKTTGPKEGQVDLFDLLKAALRSRPDYIIPGEVRGAEGNIVFQAMQTGHPVMTTFHAGNVTKVIQRFTGDPINVPKTFMDNLDFVLIQLAIERDGKMIRRCVSIDEIEGYNREVDGIMARKAFEWKAESDVHLFTANKNSYILEEKIAKNAGYVDTAEIYVEYQRRKQILERMVEERIFDYYDVVQCIWGYYRDGLEGLPFSVV
ncbi:MAG: type II/IV secretion system ATPase subunit [Thermoplasmatota archaeon]